MANYQSRASHGATTKTPRVGQGHNSGGIVGDKLRSFIERIERLHEEKKALTSDEKELYAEARGQGFDPKIIRLLVRERRLDPDDLDEQESLMDVYRRALGMRPRRFLAEKDE